MKELFLRNREQLKNTNKYRDRMLATNKDFRGKYTTLRSMLDFNSDEEVARVVRENLSASRGRLARHRNAQHRKYTTEDNGFPRCLDTEVSVTKS